MAGRRVHHPERRNISLASLEKLPCGFSTLHLWPVSSRVPHFWWRPFQTLHWCVWSHATNLTKKLHHDCWKSRKNMSAGASATFPMTQRDKLSCRGKKRRRKGKKQEHKKFRPALIKLAALLNCELRLVQTSTNFQPPNFWRSASARLWSERKTLKKTPEKQTQVTPRVLMRHQIHSELL